MAVASDTAGVSNAIEPSPSDTSLRSRQPSSRRSIVGFRPLRRGVSGRAKMDSTEHRLRADGGWVCRIADSATRRGLLDAVRSKRNVVALGATMVAAAALIIAFWPSFPLVLAALVLQGITGGFLGLAIAAISLGLVGQAALGERLGSNQRFASTGEFSPPVLWASSVISCRIARFSWPPRLW
jgi:hypothetical protein